MNCQYHATRYEVGGWGESRCGDITVRQQLESYCEGRVRYSTYRWEPPNNAAAAERLAGR